MDRREMLPLWSSAFIMPWQQKFVDRTALAKMKGYVNTWRHRRHLGEPQAHSLFYPVYIYTLVRMLKGPQIWDERCYTRDIALSHHAFFKAHKDSNRNGCFSPSRHLLWACWLATSANPSSPAASRDSHRLLQLLRHLPGQDQQTGPRKNVNLQQVRCSMLLNYAQLISRNSIMQL